MTTGRIIELGVAVALLAAGLWAYRRRDKGDSYGSQGAVILFVIAAILAIHGSGALRYHPSPSEIDSMAGRSQ